MSVRLTGLSLEMVSEQSLSSLSLEWTETRPGVHERALDGLEKFFDFISRVGQGWPDRCNWCCFAGIKVVTKRNKVELISDLRQA